jgi:hypothetical protein
VNAVATLWSKAEFLKPWSLHSYFDPRQILVQDHLSAASVVLLASIALLATKVAFVHFRRRDLP